MSKAITKGRTMFVLLCIIVFAVSFAGSVAFKFSHKPSWLKEFSVEWSDSMGTVYTDLSYGEKDANKFDLYVPIDDSKESYGLVVYLHAGGFTSVDQADDTAILQYL